MMRWKNYLAIATDIIFPPTDTVLSIRTLSDESLTALCRPRAATLENRVVEVFFEYRHPLILELIAELKYRNSMRAAELFGHVLYDYLLEETADRSLLDRDDSLLIVPVPLSPARMKERGYNQSERVANALCTCASELFELSVPEAFVRAHETKSQTAIKHRGERIANVKGAFEVRDPELFYGRDCMLLDDVATTGSTLREAAIALERANPKSIRAFALAH